MIKVLNSFDIKANFWKINPQLRIAFKEIHDADKSKEKLESSSIMWAIALILDTESKYFNMPILERKQLIAREYLKDASFNFEKYKHEMNLYEKLTITPAKRQLTEWSRIMDEKSELLKSLSYTTETWEIIEKMLKSNKDLYSELERISELLVKEGERGTIKGGSVESASEGGLV